MAKHQAMKERFGRTVFVDDTGEVQAGRFSHRYMIGFHSIEKAMEWTNGRIYMNVSLTENNGQFYLVPKCEVSKRIKQAKRIRDIRGRLTVDCEFSTYTDNYDYRLDNWFVGSIMRFPVRPYRTVPDICATKLEKNSRGEATATTKRFTDMAAAENYITAGLQ